MTTNHRTLRRPLTTPPADTPVDATAVPAQRAEAKLLRVEEAAALLCVGRSTAYELIRSGQLASLKIGGSRRVPRVAVDAFIASLQRTEVS